MTDLAWNKDNREFIFDFLESLDLSEQDKQVIRWAYEDGWEKRSDGETWVADKFLGGIIKDPAGVVHDYINRVKGHTTPDGHVWTAWEANALYRRTKKALGSSWTLRWRRWLGITISIPLWWV